MPFPADSALGALMATLPRAGQVRWIGLRTARDAPMVEVAEAQAVELQVVEIAEVLAVALVQ